MTICRSIRFIFLVAGLAFTPATGAAQTVESENADASPVDSEARDDTGPEHPAVERLLDQALGYAENDEWDLALGSLDKAETIDPGDPRIPSYRASVKELQAVDAAQNSWIEGEPEDVKQEDVPEETDPEETDPRFTIDRGDRSDRIDSVRYRDQLRIDLALKFFALDPIINDSMNTWSSLNEVLYSSLNLDLRYWFPFLRRSLGLYFGSNGYSWRPGGPTVLFNALDLGINFRGFLLESPGSRMEIGTDFGASLHSENAVVSGQIQRKTALFLGFWIGAPVLYHVFNAELLENFLLGAGIRIYTAEGVKEFIETLNYRVEGFWRFGNGQAGGRLEWWDFSASGTRRNMFSFSLFVGFRY